MSVIITTVTTGLTSTTDIIVSVLGQMVDKDHSLTITDGET